MKSIKTRFGTVEYDPSNVLHFPDGIIGFPQLHDYIVMPNKKDGPLFWIQSVEAPEIAFIVTDPRNFFLDYQVAPNPNEKQALGLEGDDEYFVLSVVTVPQDQKITVNLAAPIIFVPKNNTALQVVLEDSDYQTKTPLPH